MDACKRKDFLQLLANNQHAALVKCLDAEIENCSRQSSTRQQLYINRGLCFLRLQLYRKALKDFDEALRFNPRCMTALYQKGIVLVALKKIKEAEACWNAALLQVQSDTDLSLITAIQQALADPAQVLKHVDTLSYWWACCTRPSILTILSFLVAILAFILTRHSFQVAANIAASASIYAPRPVPSEATTTSANIHTYGPNVSHTPPPPPAAAPTNTPTPAPSDKPSMPPQADTSRAHVQQQGVSVRQPSTPPATEVKTSSSVSGVKEQDDSTSTQQSTSQKSGSSKKSQNTSKVIPPTTPHDDDCIEVDCAAQQQATRSQQDTSQATLIVNAPAAPPPTSHHQPASRAGAATPPSGSANGNAQDKMGSKAGSSSSLSGKQGKTSSVPGGVPQVQQQPGLVPGTQIDVNAAIQLAVAQINSGQVEQATKVLDILLTANPRELGARVARGTARALQRKLEEAVEDFSVAIEIEPRYADTWKRRGQARSALGFHEEALTDLQKAIDLLPLWPSDSVAASQAECYVEKGLAYQKQRDYRRATAELQRAVELDPRNHQAWNLLGLSSTSQGDLKEGMTAYEMAVKLKPDLKEAWFNMAQARKEAGLIKEADAAFHSLMSLDPPDKVHVPALKVMAQMRQQSGRHWEAVKLLDKALPHAKDEQVVELLFVRAICHHALGLIRSAVRDYESCLSGPPRNASTGGVPKALPDDTRSLQYLSFYQKEMALQMYHNLDKRVDTFLADANMPPLFKEMWCKKSPPSPELISGYTPQPELPPIDPSKPAQVPAKTLSQLIELADKIGAQLQNKHQGFLPNIRQQRAAGLACLEMAQTLDRLIAARKAGRTVKVDSAGASVTGGQPGQHDFGWRDAMDIIVKWRQLAEPNDQVIWVDLLTKREFEQGFGSHTPIFSGQTKCVRYYMNFDRALALQKEVLLKEGHAFDANNRPVPCGSEHQQDSIKAAKTCQDMYSVLTTDSWVVVPIASVSRPNHSMEGTRLTLVKVPNQPDAFEFSIRTPVTPPRWRDFDKELEAAFEAVLDAMSAETMDRPAVAKAILTFAYYWYNFMPLARGTAACGYTTILSMFWAAGMPANATIPKNYQVDWEAILSQHPDQFMHAVGAWLLPAAARQQGSGGKAAAVSSTLAPATTYPSITEHLFTIRRRLEALNPAGVPKP